MSDFCLITAPKMHNPVLQVGALPFPLESLASPWAGKECLPRTNAWCGFYSLFSPKTSKKLVAPFSI